MIGRAVSSDKIIEHLGGCGISIVLKI